MEALTRVAVALLQPAVDEHRGGKQSQPGWGAYADTADSHQAMMAGDTESCTNIGGGGSENKEEKLSGDEMEETKVLEMEETEEELSSDGDDDEGVVCSGDEEMTESQDEDTESEDVEGYSTGTATKNANQKTDEYWLDPGWTPTDRMGRPVKPLEVRKGLLKYLKETDVTKTAFLEQLGVNANSFNKFVTPSAYKGEYNTRALMNSCYLKGARFVSTVRGARGTFVCYPYRRARAHTGVSDLFD